MDSIARHPLIQKFEETYADLALTSSPQILFHYTSIDVLKRIIKSDTLWMKHAQDCNDVKEFAHGTQLFIEELKNLESEGVDRKRKTFLSF